VSQELIYTSAPQGLKPGSRGFCTVVATAGMPKNLSERLESLSGYRHAFMGHEGQAAQNPVNFAHYRIPLGGRRYHVLSRICDAGLDYTQRTNKLAHHVALEPHETAVAPGGPAWVLRQGLCVQRWDGKVETRPAGPQPAATDCPTRVCETWQRLAGDAGWAGVLAESAAQPNQVMSVIFPPGTDTLQLVVEALSLLPPEKRWEVTFSTYFTKTAGVDCQWRFILDGTPEATAVRNDKRAGRIDLVNPRPLTSSSELVTAAREGAVAYRAEARRAGPAQRVAARPAVPSGPPREATAEDAAAGYRLAPPELPPPPSGLPLPPPPRPSEAWLVRGTARTILKAAAALAGLAIVGVAAFFLGGHFAGTGGPQIASPNPEPVTPLPDEKPKIVEPTPQPVYDPTDLLPEDIRKQAQEKKPKEEAQPPAPDEFFSAPPTQTAPQEPPKPKRPPVFEDILKRQNRLELPPLRPIKASVFDRNKLNPTPQKLAKLYVEDVKDCKLEIKGQEFASSGGKVHRLQIKDRDGVRSWDVITEVAATKTETLWASFQLERDELSLQWLKDPPIRLQLCKLAITVGGKTQLCRLTAVETVKAIQLDQAPATPIALKSLETTYREGDDVRVELRFHGIEGAAFQGKRVLKIGDSDTVRMTNPHVTPEMGDSTVEIDVSLAQSSQGQRPHLLAEVVAWPEREAKTGGYEKVRHALTATALSEWRNTLQALAAKRAEETLGKLEREKRSKWIRLPAEKRQTALAYQELDEQAGKLALDETKRGEVNRLVKRMDEFPTEIKDAVSEFGLRVQGRLGQLRQYEQAVHFVSAKQAWCDAMEKFQQELYNAGRLEYRVYMETADGQIDLEMTEGFVPKPPKPKPT